MKIVKLNNNISMDLIDESINILSNGGVILYPTDTVYGLGANIFDKGAVNHIYNIKKRSKDKPLSICVSSLENISLVANINKEQYDFMNDYLPGPYTFLLKKANIIPEYVAPFTDKIGVRIPDSLISQLLSSIFPIITTSANISNKTTFNNVDDIIEQLGSDIDLVLDAGVLGDNKPSTIIDLTKDNPNILRS